MPFDSIVRGIEARSAPSLPAGVKSPLALLAAVKKARVPLGIPTPVMELLDLLFGFTEPRDWGEGSRPIVWPSNRFLADQLGLERSGVQKRIRQGVALGLFVMKDAPNGQRRGRRAPGTGAILLDESFGFDLSPLAQRFAEFKSAGDHHRAAYREREACRRRGFIAKSALLQIAETVDEEDLWSPLWEDLTTRQEALFIVLRASTRAEELERAVDALEAMRANAEAWLTAALAEKQPAAANETSSSHHERDENQPMGSLLGAPKNTTDPILSNPITGKRALRMEGSAGGEGAPQPATRFEQEAPPRPEFEDRVALSVLLDAAPDLAMFCPEGSRSTWNDAAAAAQRICAHWEISQRNWSRACQILGRAGAVVAFAVMVHQHSRGGISSPGGYFYRMIERAERGELDLVRSYHGIRTRLYGRERRTAH